MTETLVQVDSRRGQRATAGIALILGGLVFVVAEFIAAAAWTDPPYSYTYHYISNLGVHGPTEGFGQVMYSPLAWVMNTGFLLFGITLFAGTALLANLRGPRGWAVRALGFVVAVGGVLLALHPGSGETPDSGAVDLHSIGALASIVGGNVLVVVLGRAHRQAAIAATTGRAMVVLGVFGLVSLVGFLSVAGTSAGLIGLVERCAVYPVLIGCACAGWSIVRGRR
ncbi:hypothetical protein GCM10009557_37850 [Virgisporangium ochraceum]|uniref:DUF998 domain-containing protein n=1 Tax=Virgisporangium ochraceum TaxID=65505 RepID=A0A8J3ZZI6_9ACTN|nr:DUF998 domain-containing protein [Virgisporangium ochraceum]GIJ72466.1 hypothetical protein Voc01_073830 [Virgisporangium ochraceum]